MFFCPPFYIDTIVPIYYSSFFLREDENEKKVYYYDLNTERDSLFFDFSLSAGDTSHLGMIVDSIGTVQLPDGSYRRTTTFFGGVFLIEGVGNFWSLFVPTANSILIGGNYSYCYGINNTPLLGELCNSVFTNSKSIILNKSISISPNPFDTYLKFQSENLSIKSVHLFDAMGKEHNTTYNSGKLNTLGVPKGIYILHIEGEGFRIVKKAVKL